MKMSTLAVLMTCHNRKTNTLASIDAFLTAARNVPELQCQIYLVDDGSTDGTSAAVQDLYPQVKILRGDGNLFWNRGMIASWTEAAKGDYDFYLWLNDDTLLYSDALLTLWKDSIQFGHQAAITGVCEDVKRTNITYSGVRLKDKKRITPNGKPIPCDYFNGNLVLIPRYVFKQVGPLDTVFHHGLGDFEYGLRIKQQGLMAYTSSKINAVCDRHLTLPKWCDPQTSLKKRMMHFKTPLGAVPKQVYVLEKRHFGLPTAIFHYFTIHLRLLFPSLWQRLGKAHI